MPLFVVLFNCLANLNLVHIKQEIITVAQLKMMSLLVLFVIAQRKEFLQVVGANALQADLMMALMNYALNATHLGINLFLLLKFINSSVYNY